VQGELACRLAVSSRVPIRLHIFDGSSQTDRVQAWFVISLIAMLFICKTDGDSIFSTGMPHICYTSRFFRLVCHSCHVLLVPETLLTNQTFLWSIVYINDNKQNITWHFVTNLFFYGELLAPSPTPKLENHPFYAVRDCFFSILTATFHIWRPSPPSATWGRAMPWWQKNHNIQNYDTGFWWKRRKERDH
jgi:hypothetical protein